MITMRMRYVSASDDKVCDINSLVPSLLFWARGRVVRGRFPR